jgi:hypothetical protein
MATKKTPLQQVKEQHKDKESLVDRLVDLVKGEGEEKDAVKARLLAASNQKLLRLFDAMQELRSKFGGSREALAEAVAKAMGKAKDKDYIAKLAKYTPPRLVALYHSVAGKKKTQAA